MNELVLFFSFSRVTKHILDPDVPSGAIFCHTHRVSYIHFLSKIFLGGAPTSICHFFRPSACRASYLRNRTSPNHNFWYTCVKWWYLQAFLFIFLKFWLFGLLKGQKGLKKGCKRAKNSPKWKIINTFVTRLISGTA